MKAAAWIGLVLGGGLVAGLAALLNRVLRPAREARLYTDDARASTETVLRQLAALDELAEAPGRVARLEERL